MTDERTGPHAGEHWGAVWNTFRDHYAKYQRENPSWQAFFTEHHMYALDEALRAYDHARGFATHWGLQASDGVVFGCSEATAATLCPDNSTPVSRLVGPWTPATPQAPAVDHG